ncbi:hypothetical protein Gpo141_00000642 [Globisporangium polare]
MRPMDATEATSASGTSTVMTTAATASGGVPSGVVTGGGATVVASAVDVPSVAPGGSVTASSVVSTSSSSTPIASSAGEVVVNGVTVVHSTVSCPDVAAAAMSVLNGGADRLTSSSSSSSSESGVRSPASSLAMDGDLTRREDADMNAGSDHEEATRARPDRLWRRTIPRELRGELVHAMLEELQRITGRESMRHLRMCAARYESFVWRKSENQIQYLHKLERRIQSLRCQPSAHHEVVRSPRLGSAQEQLEQLQQRQQQQDLLARQACPISARPSSSSSDHRRTSNRRRPSHRHGHSHHHHHRHNRTSPASSSSSPRSRSSSVDGMSRDERYFRKLRIMKAKYRDEVALVFRELCRVNTVIQHSASLRRHESNNLGDFLANLKKIIYLLEQQPDEMNGMIPARKRTLEYLDVVESHIQRKVLPILYRLRHTYSTILRPIVLNYLKNSGRFSRR